jgi:alpha-beta hydrolase superfamily lysophospholipase
LGGHADNFRVFQGDLLAWIQALEAKSLIGKRQPRIFFGHSLGGLIALEALTSPHGSRLKATGLALSAPAVSILSPFAQAKPLLDFGLPALLEKLHVPTGLKPKALSRDPEAQQNYANDPLVRKNLTIALFRGMLEAMEGLKAEPQALGIPVAIFFGDSDPIVDPKAIRVFANSLEAQDKEIHEFRGCLHEVFHDLKKDEAYARFEKWLNKCGPKNPTPKKSKLFAKSSAREVTAKATSRSPRAKKAISTSTLKKRR